MTDAIRFSFDPLCPWCYQTSRWVRRLQQLGEVEVTWGVFSLEIANAEEGVDVRDTAWAGRALRTVVAVREAAGDHGVDRFYEALGAAVHQRGDAVEDPAVVTAALAEAGLDPDLTEQAVADPVTWDAVATEHHDLVAATRSFSVPTITLDGGRGPAIFGPVISEPPSDDDAVELFRHVSWLARYKNFSELKRDRTITPDLESVRRYEAQAAEAEAAAG